MTQTMQDEFEVEYKIPIEITGLPESAMITSELPEHISVMVKDKGTTLFARRQSGGFTPISINYKDYTLERGAFFVPAVTIVESVKKQLPPTHQIVSIFPEGISVYVSTGDSKELEVGLAGQFVPSLNCVISGEVKIQPNRITLFGPKSMLDSIEQVMTEYVEIHNLTDTVTMKVKLNPIKGVKFEIDEVNVFIPVEEFTEKSLVLPVIGRNVPRELRLRTFPPQVKISFFVGLSKFSNVTDTSFILSVDSRYLADHPTAQTIPVYIERAPEYVSNVRIEPDSVEFVFEEVYTYD
ncbi:YbbR-like domain-containing protein [Porphyromonadaceae bacterium]